MQFKPGDLVRVRNQHNSDLLVVLRVGSLRPVTEDTYGREYVWVHPLDPADNSCIYDGVNVEGWIKEEVEHA